MREVLRRVGEQKIFAAIMKRKKNWIGLTKEGKFVVQGKRKRGQRNYNY